MKLWQLNVIGTVVHFLLFCSVIELYFTSPLVHVTRRYSSRMEPPAKRVVLISADGLRADKLFGLDELGGPRAPYLRSMIEKRGTWGLSHTRIPTGSRHGHIALIAGFYEDIISVTKGWAENVGDFDSAFNQSRYAWGWGSPKVLSMFPGDPTRNHVVTNSPPPGMETIASPEELDTWELHSVRNLFDSARRNETLMRRLKEGKIMFFLHLMGIDTTSHSHKPHSQEYARHVKTVDDIIRGVTELMDRFYDDNKTAYIVTSDHGMTDWGAHGAGDPVETQTPLIAWGPGIRTPRVTNGTCGVFGDSFCQDWRLQHRARTDVLQADVAALISFLINIPFPANNMGVLPVDLLSCAEKDKAEGMATNAGQVLAQYQVKMKEVKDRTPAILFQEFHELPASDQVNSVPSAWNLIDEGKYSEAIAQSKSVIDKSLRGLHYYQLYNQNIMRAILTLFFLGWISFLLHLLLSQGTSSPQHSRPSWKSVFSVGVCCYFTGIGFICMLWLFLNGLPRIYYMYCLAAMFLWMKFLKGSQMMHAVMKQRELKPLVASFAFCVLYVELMVLCFFYIPLLSVGLVAMAAWAFTTPLWRVNRSCCVRWIVSCLLVAIFPALPVAKGTSNYSLVFLAGFLIFLVGSYLLWRLVNQNGTTLDFVPKTVLCIQLALVAVATLIVKVATDRIALKEDPLPLTQGLSWLILVSSPVLPLLTGGSLEVRLFSVSLAFTGPFILTSYTYDGLLLLAFLSNLRCWLRMETALSGCQGDSNGHLPQVTENGFGPKAPKAGPSGGNCLQLLTPNGHKADSQFQLTSGRLLVTGGDVRRAIFCMVLAMTSFYGADNVPNINTHDPVVAFCFFTAFKPPGIATLVLVKVAIPFLLVMCALRAVLSKTRGSFRSGLLMILLLTDFIILNFFFLVGDYGNWQEIGASISHYAIIMLMIIMNLWTPGLAHFLVPIPEESS